MNYKCQNQLMTLFHVFTLEVFDGTQGLIIIILQCNWDHTIQRVQFIARFLTNIKTKQQQTKLLTRDEFAHLPEKFPLETLHYLYDSRDTHTSSATAHQEKHKFVPIQKSACFKLKKFVAVLTWHNNPCYLKNQFSKINHKCQKNCILVFLTRPQLGNLQGYLIKSCSAFVSFVITSIKETFLWRSTYSCWTYRKL